MRMLLCVRDAYAFEFFDLDSGKTHVTLCGYGMAGGGTCMLFDNRFLVASELVEILNNATDMSRIDTLILAMSYSALQKDKQLDVHRLHVTWPASLASQISARLPQVNVLGMARAVTNPVESVYKAYTEGGFNLAKRQITAKGTVFTEIGRRPMAVQFRAGVAQSTWNKFRFIGGQCFMLTP